MTLTLISDTAREWGKAKFKDMQAAKGRRLSHRELAGFIGEAVVREYMERELLLDAAHGPLYGNDLIVENCGVEVKTQTSPFAWRPSFWAWAPGWKPDDQDAIVFTYMQIAQHDFESVLTAEYLRLRGWIAETDTHGYPVLARGSDTPLKDGDTLTCDVLQVPDADLSPMIDFVEFCLP